MIGLTVPDATTRGRQTADSERWFDKWGIKRTETTTECLGQSRNEHKYYTQHFIMAGSFHNLELGVLQRLWSSLKCTKLKCKNGRFTM